MMHAHSSSSNSNSNSTATPIAMANTAVYDPLSKCIKLPSASSAGGAFLEGSIIEMETPLPFPFGRMLLGEITEIVIMDENFQPLAVHDENTAAAEAQQAGGGMLTPDDAEPPSPTREELIHAQREQQQHHMRESQDLLQKHREEKQQLDMLEREGRLSRENKYQLSAEMEETHDQELMELQDEHNKEQSELMDLIFESASSAKGVDGVDNGGKSKWKPKTKKRQEREENSFSSANTAPANNSNAKDMWNRAAVTAVAAGTMNNQQQVNSEEIELVIEESHPIEQNPESNELAGLWSRAAVATVSAGTFNQHHNQDEEPPITANASTPQVSNAKKKNMERRKQEELQALRREEVQSAMKDKTLGREEKQKQLAAIKSKYAALASAQSAPPEPLSQIHRQSPASASRWNKAAVFAVAENTMTHHQQGSSSRNLKPPPPPQPPLHEQKSNNAVSAQPAPGPNRWKRGAVSALAANTINKSYRHLKEEEGSNTPMREFIHKVKSNDPSLTTLILDGRKDVSEDEWSQFFDGLEDNAMLTHLSIANCGLDDDIVIPLVMALVENETLTYLDMSKNRGLTSSTGKTLLKVLKQSNPILKIVRLLGTKISSKTQGKIQDLLDERDETKQMEKLQAERQKKIKDLLAFSASDEASVASRRVSMRLLQVENKDEEMAASGGNKSKPKQSNSAKETTPGKKSRPAREKRSSQGSLSSGGSSTHSRGSGGHKSSVTSSTNGTRRKTRGHLSHSTSSNQSHASSGIRSRSKTKSSIRSSTTATRHMAQLGGDIGSGKSAEELRAGRKMRGECENCGQKICQKTMFKSTPLTVPNKVFEGRCLLCNPM